MAFNRPDSQEEMREKALAFRKQCSTASIAALERMLLANPPGTPRRKVIQEFLVTKRHEDQQRREAAEDSFRAREVAATESAAQSAEEANRHAKAANFRATVALWLSGAAVLATIGTEVAKALTGGN